MRGEISAHVEFEARNALLLAVLAVEGAECKDLIDCPEGKATKLRLPPAMTVTASFCTVLE